MTHPPEGVGTGATEVQNAKLTGWALTAVIGLGAFLLFQVQPLLAKRILPWFGGGASVWTTCMLFFQVLLLGGYAYAAALQRFSIRTQALLQLALLGGCLFFWPLGLDAAWKPLDGLHPIRGILFALGRAVGLPYLALSTTAPLIQAWVAREGRVPYRLYALSNFGSFLALLSYPLLVEPRIGAALQARIWSMGFLGYAGLFGYIAWRRSSRSEAVVLEKVTGRLKVAEIGRWVLFSGASSSLLLAVTSHLTHNVAPIPLLWVLPLSLYLLSYILCFESQAWYRPSVFLPAGAVVMAGMILLLFEQRQQLSVWWQIPAFLGGLFIAFMVAHGELAATRPHPRAATTFYLATAVGGALGGVFTGIVAPTCFNGWQELPVALGVMILVLHWGTRGKARPWQRVAWGSALGVLWLLVILQVYQRWSQVRLSRVATRNFYGVVEVLDEGHGEYADRTLIHGTIEHGMEFLHAPRHGRPTAYYGPNSGVALGLAAAGRRGPMRVGLVGMGVGTLAAYGRSGDLYRFYELDPLVISLARDQFTFLSDSRAKVEVLSGDGRLALEREPAGSFDVLVLDAFSGDAIPVHLLTLESFATCLRLLRPGGLICVHTSNRYLDLEPVLKAAATHFGAKARLVADPGNLEQGYFHSNWVLLTPPGPVPGPYAAIGTELAPRHAIRPWTDDASDLMTLIR